MMIERRDVIAEVDSGSSVNLTSAKAFEQFGDRYELVPIFLRVANGQQLVTLGKISMQCKVSNI